MNGITVVRPDVFTDDRGYFYESFSAQKYKDVVGDFVFVQDNVSYSQKGTVRGLHYQIGEFAQGKLCEVLYGSVLDVAVDIRFGSATFGQHFAVELTDENHTQLWLPPGFAHGFSVLSDEAVFHYKCTARYSKAHERAIRYNDPDLNIDWKTAAPIVSPKDMAAPFCKDIAKDFSL